MTLGELRTTYSSVHKEYNSTKYDLSVKLNDMKDRVANTPNGQELYGDQADPLDEADNTETDLVGPDIVSVDDVIAAATPSSETASAETSSAETES
jgi:hypothetical protein